MSLFTLYNATIIALNLIFCCLPLSQICLNYNIRNGRLLRGTVHGDLRSYLSLSFTSTVFNTLNSLLCLLVNLYLGNNDYNLICCVIWLYLNIHLSVQCFSFPKAQHPTADSIQDQVSETALLIPNSADSTKSNPFDYTTSSSPFVNFTSENYLQPNATTTQAQMQLKTMTWSPQFSENMMFNFDHELNNPITTTTRQSRAPLSPSQQPNLPHVAPILATLLAVTPVGSNAMPVNVNKVIVSAIQHSPFSDFWDDKLVWMFITSLSFGLVVVSRGVQLLTIYKKQSTYGLSIFGYVLETVILIGSLIIDRCVGDSGEAGTGKFIYLFSSTWQFLIIMGMNLVIAGLSYWISRNNYYNLQKLKLTIAAGSWSARTESIDDDDSGCCDDDWWSRSRSSSSVVAQSTNQLKSYGSVEVINGVSVSINHEHNRKDRSKVFFHEEVCPS